MAKLKTLSFLDVKVMFQYLSGGKIRFFSFDNYVIGRG